MFDQMKIVQNNDAVFVNGGFDFTVEGVGQVIRVGAGSGSQGGQNRLEVGVQPLECGNQPNRQCGQVGVGVIQLIPGHRVIGIVGEIYEQRTLAIARRRRYEDQFAMNVFVDKIKQALPTEQIRQP